MDKQSSNKIKKIKYLDSTSKVMIDFSHITDGNSSEMTGIFSDEPAPEFFKALDMLQQPAINILELNEIDCIDERLFPYAVTYRYDRKDNMSAVISCKFMLTNSDSCVVINTPIRKVPEQGVQGIEYFSEDAVKALTQLQIEARNYLNGKRAQMSLFGDASDDLIPEEEKTTIFKKEPGDNITYLNAQ
jgi:hypothetical protein